MSVIAVSVVRDEADIIETTIRQLVGEGVDHLIVADNLSTDDTPKILRRLVDDGLPITVEQDDDPAHNQGVKITRLAQQAAKMGATWVLPFDADELWYSPNPDHTIATALAALPVEVDVVAAFGYDHLARSAENERDRRLSPWRRKTEQPLPKVAFRARLDRKVAEGNHGCTPAHQPVRGPLAFRHYQYRSHAQMIRKVRQGSAALALADVPEHTGQHWHDAAELSDAEIVERFQALQMDFNIVYDPAPLCDSALPTVTIVIPTYNRDALLNQTLSAVQDTAPEVEVIVVDNGSTDETFDVCEKHGVDIIVNDTNLGFAVACNQGARAATTDRVLFLNNDTVPQPGWLTAMNRHRPCIVGAALYYPDGRPQHTGVFLRHDPQGRIEAYNRTLPAPSALVPAVTGAALLIDRTLFDQLDGFDEGFVNGYEDVDLCLRARQRGVDVAFAADATVVHLESQTEGRFAHAADNIARLNDRWGDLEI